MADAWPSAKDVCRRKEGVNGKCAGNSAGPVCRRINKETHDRKETIMKILLCCNAGMSSSILVKKIRQAAEKRGMDVTITAVPSAAVRDEVGKWDVCLVGPQLVYAVANIKSQLNIPVASVEPRTYAMADGDKALDFAMSLMEG